MFAVSFLDNGRQDPAFGGKKVFLRHPTIGDHAAWASLRRQSRSFLQPWEPAWHRNDLGRYAFRDRIKHYQREIRQGTSLPWFIFRQSDDALVGGITLTHIRRGASQSAQIGYWMGEPFAGRGYMAEALDLVVTHAFTRCGLHRLEAACIPSNARSLRLLETAGFEQEGILRAYLKINGQWRDHVLLARINPATI